MLFFFPHLNELKQGTKLYAMKIKYEGQNQFVTIAPPEHDDIILFKIHKIRQEKIYNTNDSILFNENLNINTWLSEDLINSARKRITVAQEYPAQCVFLFERVLKSFFNSVIKCPINEDIKVIRPVSKRNKSLYGTVDGFIGVIEPQKDSRLHLHLSLYNSIMTGSLLSKVCICDELQKITKEWIDGVCHTHLSDRTHKWIKSFEGKVPKRDFTVIVSRIDEDLDTYIFESEKKLYSTNEHSHSFTCEYGLRGLFMCRLSMPRGINNIETRPILIILKQRLNVEKKQKAEFDIMEVDDDMSNYLDRPHKYTDGELIKVLKSGPIIWEKFKPDIDKYFVETNLHLALLNSHSNSAFISTSDHSDAVDEYEADYMTKY